MTIMESELRDILGHPNYSVTRDGRVWSKPRKDRLGRPCGGRFLSPNNKRTGYLYVCLNYNGDKNERAIHRLVLEAFVGPCAVGHECRHLDGNRKNNQLENLQWGTSSENQQDRITQGTIPRGSKHYLAKLDEETARVIFDSYHDGIATLKELASAFGVSQQTVSMIVNKQAWKHIWNQ